MRKTVIQLFLMSVSETEGAEREDVIPSNPRTANFEEIIWDLGGSILWPQRIRKVENG